MSDRQTLADVPDQQFETALADPTQMSTISGILRGKAEPKVRPVADDALWLAKCVGETTTKAASIAWPCTESDGGHPINTPMRLQPTNVCCWGRSRKHILTLRISGFGPEP